MQQLLYSIFVGNKHELFSLRASEYLQLEATEQGKNNSNKYRVGVK